MKKYAIRFNKGQRELRKRVNDALVAVGFAAKYTTDCEGYVSISLLDDREVSQGGFLETYLDCEILNPSYVIAHADELDGAKKAWEVAPDGMRFATDEERKLPIPDGAFYCTTGSLPWKRAEGLVGHTPTAHEIIAVPLDFTFPPVVNPRIKELRDCIVAAADELVELTEIED